MNKQEKGQGLVEYQLILVLVPIVVIAILLLLGPEITEQFCATVDGLGGTVLDLGDYEVVMGIDDDHVVIDVKPESASWTNFICKWEIHLEPSHGSLVNNNDGTYSYYPYVVGYGIDDHFMYRVIFTKQISGRYNGYGNVAIIIGGRDAVTESAASETSSAIIEENSTPSQPDEEIVEQILTFFEVAQWQEERIWEGIELNKESVLEGIEVMADYAEDAQNQLFYENLSLFQQAVLDGNLDAVIATYDSLDFPETPLDVYVAMNLKMAPRLIAACEAVSSGSVPSQVIENALQSAQEIDDSHPGKAEILQSIQTAVDIVETRNVFTQEHKSFQMARIQRIIELLEFAGYSDLAAELVIESEACGD